MYSRLSGPAGAIPMKTIKKHTEKIKHLSLRTEEPVLQKFRHICKCEKRSANSQLLILVLAYIHEFEKTHGAPPEC